MNSGWIKLHRELLDKAIWSCSTPEQKVVLITLLLNVNYESKQWEWKGQKYECRPGQLITSIDSLAHLCGCNISSKNVRTALKKFEKYGMDPCALNTTQVIRLPGTINSRTGRIVQVLELNDTEYTLQQLAKQLPWSKEQVGVHKKEGKKKRKKVDWDLSKRRPYYKDL